MATDVLSAAQAPDSYHLRTKILVHGRRKQPFGTCSCCDSEHAEVVKTIDDYDRVIISPELGARYVLGRDPPELRRAAFNRFADQCEEEHTILLRCTEEQYDLLVDDYSRIVCALGGLGSGKTMTMGSWFVRKWVLRGGPGALFWIVSHTLDGAYFVLRRLLFGDYAGDRVIAPIMPAGLAVSVPKSVLQSDKKTYLIDGSMWDLRHASYRSATLKMVSVQDVLTDETCEFRSLSAWLEIVGRTRESRGQVAASTVPEDGHWLQKQLAERKDTDAIRVKSLSMRDNVWLHPDEYQTQVELIGDDATKRRVLDGEWTKTGPKVWRHWDRDRHTVSGVAMDCEGYHVYVEGVQRKLISLNEQFGIVVFPFHKGGWRFLGGQDFNAWPMGTIWWQLCHPEGTDPQDPENWHVYVADEVVTGSATRPSTIYHHCEYMVDIHEHRPQYEVGIFRDLPVSCDASGEHHRASSDNEAEVMIAAMCEYGYSAQPCRMSVPTQFNQVQKPENPLIMSRVAMIHRLMRDGRFHVHERCSVYIHALENQLATDRGKPKKNPGTASDRLSSTPDAGGYAYWPFFGEPVV